MKMQKVSFLLMTFVLFSCGSGGKQTNSTSQNDCEVLASDTQGVVKTQSGKVVGYTDDGVYIYKGIPYARADRFMPPVAPAAWEGVRSSRAYGPTCPQEERQGWKSDVQAFAFDWDDGIPGEDCLRVNIWTPSPDNKQKHPVMVWLHGGGYSAGSGQELPAYDGSNLARRDDVVVVSLNHRLNVLGFLDLSAFGDKYVNSGNVGMLDIVAALQWVKQNIAGFGGDPQNVTIFGQSGGGGKVSTLLAMPQAKGLFHKAIVQSGSSLRAMESKYSRRIGIATLEELGITAAQIDQLKTVPYKDLLAAGSRAITRVRTEAESEGVSSFIFGWSPTVDGRVLPAHPFDPIAPEQSKDIPMLIGTTQHEFMTSAYVPALKNITMERAIIELRKRYGERTEEWIKAFGEAYPNYQPIDLFDVDLRFRPSAVKQATLKAAQHGAPVYMYLFAWESPVLDGALRSMHCMELPFVFDNIYRARTMTSGCKEAFTLADLMSRAWVSFARTGNPNIDGLPEWPSYTVEEGATMFFNNVCEVKNKHDKALLNIIESFPASGL